jgi:NAD(P)H-dependent flavin oxidoreductase YrpB (nitropropane dioxygenase family)
MKETAALDTSFTRTFDLSVPIIQAPMASIAGAQMVAAAANAGAFGNLPIWFLPMEAGRDMIRQTRALTRKPFAVNLRADLNQTELISMAVDEGVLLFNLFWGDPAISMRTIRQAGGRLIATVSDPDTAKAALDAGAVALIAQGVEAGGHVFGTTRLQDLVPAIVELAGGVPVAAAGGIVEARDMIHAFNMRASAVVLGSCLIVTDEAEAHPGYRKALLDAKAGDTVLSKCFDGFWPNAPHRTLMNSTYRMWREADFPASGSRPGEGDIIMHAPGGMDIPRYHAAAPTKQMTGNYEAMALYTGVGVGRIADVRSTATLIRDMVAEASAGLTRSAL